jgi:hypothetical protein
VIGGGSIQKLQVILGHASITTTERYAHLASEHLRPADVPALDLELSRAGGAVVDLGAHREGARRHGVDIQDVDDRAADSVSTDAHSSSPE